MHITVEMTGGMSQRRKDDCISFGPELTVPHHKASAYVANSRLDLLSARYTRKEEKMSTRKPMYHAVTSSCTGVTKQGCRHGYS